MINKTINKGEWSFPMSSAALRLCPTVRSSCRHAVMESRWLRRSCLRVSRGHLCRANQLLGPAVICCFRRNEEISAGLFFS
ncbi:hypothetical protein MHYP_G00312700 [Metynnis hypsauchen]